MTKEYSKADLDQIVLTQLQNLNAMQDLLRIMKRQNEFIEIVIGSLKDEISGVSHEKRSQS